MSIGAPELIWLILVLVGLGIEIERHGDPKTGHYDAFTSLIAAAIGFGLLWWGGFFH